MEVRDIERRQKRAFKKLASEHSLLITLYKNDVIAMHMPELESVLWDFYMAGSYDKAKMLFIANLELQKKYKEMEGSYG